MQLSGQKFKELHTALRNAFPNVGDLRFMVRVGLEANLDEISIRSNLQEIVQDLISWAEQRDEIEKLVTVARNENSTNLELNAFRLDAEFVRGKRHGRVVHLPQRASLFFLDAAKVLEKIESAFQRSACVALHGIGGIGKSEMAGQYAHQFGHRYEGGVFWIIAPDIETARDNLASLAGDEVLALGLPPDTKRDDRLHAVRCALTERDNCLLIYDNMDWLADLDAEASQQANAEFFFVQGKSRILITSRPTIAHPGFRTIDLSDLPREEAALLLVRHARRDSELVSLDALPQTDAEAARQLAILFDGLPLALEQAGATIAEDGTLSLSDYLARYQSPEGRALRERGARFGNHKSVFYTFSEAYQRVREHTPDAAKLLCLCAFLSPDDIPLNLFAPYLFDTNSASRKEEALRVAVLHRLLDYDTGTRSASMHRVIQAVVQDILSEYDRHTYKTHVVEAVARVFPSGKFETWLLCETLLPHALLAIQWIDDEKIETERAAKLLNQTGYYLEDQARYATALSLLERALSIGEKLFGTEHPNTVAILNNLALLHKKQGEYGKALLLYERALEIQQQVAGLEHANTALSLNNLAELYKAQSDYYRALPLLERALRIQEKVLGSEHPDTAISLNNLAGMYDHQGKYSEALPLYERALATREKVLGSEHPDTATSLNNLAGQYLQLRDYNKALPLYQRALEIREAVLGAEHPDTAISLGNLAGVYYKQGEYDRALPLFERALRIQEKVLGPEHPTTATSLNNLATLYSGKKQYAKALPLLERTLAIQEKRLGAEHPATAISLNNLALLYHERKDYARALSLYERAYAILEKKLGSNHPNTQRVRENRDACLTEMQKKLP